MNLTNVHNLPSALLRAITSDPYTKGKSDYSVTELLQPPRIRALKIKHKDEIVEDAGDRIWSLLGQAVHSILERASDEKTAIAEKRYFAKFGSHIVSAQIDTLELDGAVLSDFKVTTSWKFLGNKPPPEDYVAQLNMQAEIMRSNGIIANELRIVGILRDWNMREARSNPDYPQFQVAVMPIPMWSRAKTIDFIMDRIQLHFAAESIMRGAAEGTLPLCTKEERWATDDKYAVMKGTNKRAVKLCDSLTEAQDYISNGSGDRVETRAGESRRCSSYCHVNKWCDWYQKQQTKGVEL